MLYFAVYTAFIILTRLKEERYHVFGSLGSGIKQVG